MAGRIRSIKPEILEDEKTAALSHLEWRLFVSLWLLADDFGNFRRDPTYVLGQTLWAAGETRDAVAAALERLAEIGLLVVYTVRGQSYAHIKGWDKHQKVSKPGKPRMPGPEQSDHGDSTDDYVIPGNPPETPRESPGDSPETPRPDHRSPITDHRSPSGTPARAIPPAVPQPAPPPVPAVSPPACRSLEPIAFDPSDPRALGRLAEVTYRRVSDARIKIAAELKLPEPIPFPEITPSTQTRGFVELRARLREEGAQAATACDRVVANLIAQAREERSLDWLAEQAFGDKAWPKAKDWMPGAAARRRGPARGDPLPPAPPPPRPAPPPPDRPLSPEDRAEILALAARVGANPEAAAAELAGRPSSLPTAELVKRFGEGQRAPPDTPDAIAGEPRKQPKSRKAAT